MNQRSRLQLKGKTEDILPHVLVMSATPIPRTLALILYGDLDLSVIDEMPKGRIPVKTRIVPEHKRLFQILKHFVHLCTITLADAADMIREKIPAEILIHNSLVEIGGVDIRGLFSDSAFPDDSGVTGNITDTESGRNGFTETAKEHNPAVLIIGLDCFDLFTFIPQITIRIILRNDHAILVGKFSYSFTPGIRKRFAGRILEYE